MALEVAAALAGRGTRVEIVSCDSMAVYRGLDVAADKPSAEARAAVPHHVIDIVDPAEPFTAVRYRALARAAVDDIHRRGAVPLVVGGSGLYFRALVDDLEFAPSDPAVRERLEREDPASLRDRLESADPASAARIDPRNTRRLVRTVEILELTGRPPSELRVSWERRAGPYDLCAAGLRWSRDELYRRAVERIRREIDAGLVEEVEAARRAGGISRTAWQALGVKEILEHLEGRATLPEAVERNVRNTKAFIRRQMSWFGADDRIVWVDASELGWDAARDAITVRFEAALR